MLTQEQMEAVAKLQSDFTKEQCAKEKEKLAGLGDGIPGFKQIGSVKLGQEHSPFHSEDKEALKTVSELNLGDDDTNLSTKHSFGETLSALTEVRHQVAFMKHFHDNFDECMQKAGIEGLSDEEKKALKETLEGNIELGVNAVTRQKDELTNRLDVTKAQMDEYLAKEAIKEAEAKEALAKEAEAKEAAAKAKEAAIKEAAEKEAAAKEAAKKEAEAKEAAKLEKAGKGFEMISDEEAEEAKKAGPISMSDLQDDVKGKPSRTPTTSENFFSKLNAFVGAIEDFLNNALTAVKASLKGTTHLQKETPEKETPEIEAPVKTAPAGPKR